MPVAVTPRTTLVGLMGLTLATGIIDAASLLGPGHVFTANMTGNVIFLGFALAGRGTTSVALGLVALAAFLVGAAIGGRIGAMGGTAAPRRVFPLEIAALAAAAALAPTGGTGAVVPMVALLAVAMGIRNALVRKLAVADMTTTVLTLTLTGIAADSSLAGGTNPRWRRRVVAAVSMLGGALLGAWLLPLGLRAVLGVAVVAEIASAALIAYVPEPEQTK